MRERRLAPAAPLLCFMAFVVVVSVLQLLASIRASVYEVPLVPVFTGISTVLLLLQLVPLVDGFAALWRDADQRQTWLRIAAETVVCGGALGAFALLDVFVGGGPWWQLAPLSASLYLVALTVQRLRSLPHAISAPRRAAP